MQPERPDPNDGEIPIGGFREVTSIDDANEMTRFRGNYVWLLHTTLKKKDPFGETLTFVFQKCYPPSVL